MSLRDKNSSQQPEGNRRKLKFYIYLTAGIATFTALSASAITVVVLQHLGLIPLNFPSPSPSPTTPLISSNPSPSPTVPTISSNPSPTVTPSSPISSEAPIPSTLPITVTDNNVTWVLNSCTRKNTVICNFTLSTSVPEIDYVVELNSNTEIIDISNIEYPVVKSSVLNQTASANNSLIIKMVQGGKTNLIIEYKGTPTSVNQAILIKVKTYGRGPIYFKNVPIN